ncbi:ABC transporter ATP-binding protein [Actinomyces radicidentis]|uniref:Ferrichrome ABC transporter ATP-binding protein n=1 Tax=Actinomyces radicidentis TaxID=111015 RepID=A0A0X8JFL4_ACTRD|nr:ABC transporter ATP-binding protein [Actinomyces radicidentis]AMD87731.1 ferrichrome ABC transporter ATP-binding protein [Actinomyces radicidentis]
MSLEIRDLSFAYGRRRVIHDLSVRWEPGQVVGLLGPNGCGKTTLISCLAQLRRHRGTITFDGLTGEAMREVIGYAPQGLPCDAALTALESVLVASRRGPVWRTSDADLDAAHSALERTGAAALADRSLARLSGGQRQLVALAQALVREPRLLLLDEPTSALDLAHQVGVLDAVRRRTTQGEGRLAVVALHDLNLAARACDRLALMDGGRIAAEGAPAEVLRPGLIESVYGLETHVVADGEHLMVAPGPG